MRLLFYLDSRGEMSYYSLIFPSPHPLPFIFKQMHSWNLVSICGDFYVLLMAEMTHHRPQKCNTKQ